MEPDGMLFLPTPPSVLWCFSSGKFCLVSDLSLPCCTYPPLSVTTLWGFPIVIRGFLSICSRCEAVPWPGSSVGWSVVPYTKMLQVQFLVRAQT